MSTPASFKPQPGAGTAADPLPTPEPSMSDSATGQELVEAEAGPGQAATTFITTCLRIGTQLGALPVVSRSEATEIGLELLIGLRIGTTYGHDC